MQNSPKAIFPDDLDFWYKEVTSHDIIWEKIFLFISPPLPVYRAVTNNSIFFYMKNSQNYNFLDKVVHIFHQTQ
jgi:hypothetical protein